MNTEWNAIKMNIKCANDTKKPLFLHLLHKKKSKKNEKIVRDVFEWNGNKIKWRKTSKNDDECASS